MVVLQKPPAPVAPPPTISTSNSSPDWSFFTHSSRGGGRSGND